MQNTLHGPNTEAVDWDSGRGSRCKDTASRSRGRGTDGREEGGGEGRDGHLSVAIRTNDDLVSTMTGRVGMLLSNVKPTGQQAKCHQ